MNLRDFKKDVEYIVGEFVMIVLSSLPSTLTRVQRRLPRSSARQWTCTMT